MMRSLCCATLAAFFLTAADPLAAADIGIEVVFSERETATIRAYYREHESADTGGRKAKSRKTLPPGVAKNLRQGKPLPPGIAKQVLPAPLLQRLPPPPKGYERIVVDGRILLVEIATQVIHDVLEDLFLD